ncbi:MAG: serine/threonine-protein kinase, partial [Polyangiales bacterium]
MANLGTIQNIQMDAQRRMELLVDLGAGGMGHVSLARMHGLGGFQRVVAVKYLHRHLRADPDFVRMFLDEARIAARIRHPNVVPTLEVGEADVLYLVMEYVEGETLSGLLRGAAQAGQRIPLDIALRVAVDILAGLEAAHSLQDDDGHPLRVVHRDVTPQNILVGADGVTRLLDFGIATAALRSATTKEGQLKGKFGYMAPELLDGGEASPQTDAYSAGVTIWETLTGEHLFDGKTELDVAAAVLRCVVPPLKNHRDDVPGEVEAVLRRALARDPGDRYASAAEFGRALEGAGVPLASTRAVSTFVESTVGVMLESRRAKFAAALKASPATATD